MSVLSFLTDTASSAVLSTAEQSSITTSISTLQTRLGQHFSSGVLEARFFRALWMSVRILIT